MASHADLDHRGGLPAVLARFPLERLWLPPAGLADPAFRAFVSAAQARGTAVEERATGDAALLLGDRVVTPLGPSREAGGARHDRSLVVRIDVAGHRVLLPGDLEAASEAALTGAPIESDVLALTPHGPKRWRLRGRGRRRGVGFRHRHPALGSATLPDAIPSV